MGRKRKKTWEEMTELERLKRRMNAYVPRWPTKKNLKS